MRRSSLFLLAALLLPLAACGEEKKAPAGPTEEFVGTWVFDVDRVLVLAEKMHAVRLRKDLEAKYPGDAAKVEAEMKTTLDETRERRAQSVEGYRGAKERIEIRADGTIEARVTMGPVPEQVYHGAWERRGDQVFATPTMCGDPATEAKTRRLEYDRAEGVLRIVDAANGTPGGPFNILTRAKD